MPRPRNLRAANIRELQRAKAKLEVLADNIAKVAFPYDQHKDYQLQTMGVVGEHTQYMLEACSMLMEMINQSSTLIDLMIADIDKD